MAEERLILAQALPGLLARGFAKLSEQQERSAARARLHLRREQMRAEPLLPADRFARAQSECRLFPLALMAVTQLHLPPKDFQFLQLARRLLQLEPLIWLLRLRRRALRSP